MSCRVGRFAYSVPHLSFGFLLEAGAIPEMPTFMPESPHGKKFPKIPDHIWPPAQPDCITTYARLPGQCDPCSPRLLRG